MYSSFDRLNITEVCRSIFEYAATNYSDMMVIRAMNHDRVSSSASRRIASMLAEACTVLMHL